MIPPAVYATVQFTSPGMLVLLLAVALPWLIIHRPQEPDANIGFATTAFVISAAGKRHRWHRRAAWLLPLVRSLLLGTLVIAAAGPSWLPNAPPAAPSARAVLLLDDSPQQVASAALAAAIEALAASTSNDEPGPWSCQQRGAAEMAADQLPETAHLVVIADGARPPPDLQRELASWIRHGGRVLVLLGPRSLEDPNPWLPPWLARSARVQVDPSQTASPQTIGSRLAGPQPAGVLAGPSVSRLAALTPLEGDVGRWLGPPRGPLETLLETTNSAQPLLLQRSVGLGQITISALPWSLDPTTSASSRTAWSDLAAWPLFPALVQDVLERATARTAASPGQTASLPLPWAQGWTLAGICLLLTLLTSAAEAVVAGMANQGRRTA